MNPVYDMFNDIAQKAINKEQGDEYLANTITVLGATGSSYELSLAQVKQYSEVMDGTSPYLTDYNPLEFLIFSYQFQDKIKAGYLCIQYQVIYDHDANEIHVSGLLKHPMTVKEHPEYNAGAVIPPVIFETTIDQVGLYGNMALINCIAAQGNQLAAVKGSYGGSFIYKFGNGQQSIAKYDLLETELEIDECELAMAIKEAKAKVLAGVPVDEPTLKGNV